MLEEKLCKTVVYCQNTREISLSLHLQSQELRKTSEDPESCADGSGEQRGARRDFAGFGKIKVECLNRLDITLEISQSKHQVIHEEMRPKHIVRLGPRSSLS